MADLTTRLDEMETTICKPSFRQSSGRANEVNYWVFDYPPERELEVRERIAYLKNKNQRGTDSFELVVFDLYDIIIDFLEQRGFLDKCYTFERKAGINRIVKAVNNSMKVNDDCPVHQRPHAGERGRVPYWHWQVLSHPAVAQGFE